MKKIPLSVNIEEVGDCDLCEKENTSVYNVEVTTTNGEEAEGYAGQFSDTKLKVGFPHYQLCEKCFETKLPNIYKHKKQEES